MEFFDWLEHNLALSAPSLDAEQVLNWLQKPINETTVRINRSIMSEMEQAKQELQRSLSFSDRIHIDPKIPDMITIEGKPSEPMYPLGSLPLVIVDIKTGQSVMRGAHVFIPGVITFPSCVKAGDPVHIFADIRTPNHVLKGAKGITIDDPSYTLLHLGDGIARTDRNSIFSASPAKNGIAVTMTHTECSFPSFDDIRPDIFFLQNRPSILASHALFHSPFTDPLLIWDMCCGVGGKTTHLASLCKESQLSFHILATDSGKSKIETLKKNASNIKISVFITEMKADATKPISSDTWSKLQTSRPYFEWILLDPPCSGIGQRPVLHASLRNMHIDPDSLVDSYATYQRRLFSNAFQHLSPNGGVLVYSTCTLNYEENHGIVKWALESFPSLSLVPLVGSDLPLSSAFPIDHLYHTGVSFFVPRKECDTIAFFIAKFQRNES